MASSLKLFVTLLLLLTFLTIRSEGLQVNSPQQLAGYRPSEYIVFGNFSRADFSPFTGTLLKLIPTGDCDVPITQIDEGTIALTVEAQTKTACGGVMTNYYMKLQRNPNITAVVVASTSFVVLTQSLGYSPKEDPTKITLPVTYILMRDYNDLSAVSPVVITFDNDLGPFYHWAFETHYVTGFSYFFGASYFAFSLYCIVLLGFDYHAKGCGLRNSSQILIAAFCFCAGRAVRTLIFEQSDYYMPVSLTPSISSIDRIIYWVPIAFGMLCYALTIFNWAGIVSSLQNNRFLNVIRRPYLYCFYVCILLFILLGVVGSYVDFPIFMIFALVLIFFAATEAVAIFYYGTKVLRMLGLASDLMESHKGALEKRLTIFVLCSGGCFIFAVLFGSVAVSMQLQPTPNPLIFFTLSIIRDFIFLFLMATLIFMLKRSKRERSSGRSSSNGKLSETGNRPSGKYDRNTHDREKDAASVNNNNNSNHNLNNNNSNNNNNGEFGSNVNLNRRDSSVTGNNTGSDTEGSIYRNNKGQGFYLNSNHSSSYSHSNYNQVKNDSRRSSLEHHHFSHNTKNVSVSDIVAAVTAEETEMEMEMELKLNRNMKIDEEDQLKV